jgi:predicted enzyme related to lactoylglutathione lyase
MSSSEGRVGRIGWFDLTVPAADEVASFYARVVGWEVEAHPMGEYDDHVMKDAAGEAVAGVCHARGPNAGLPPQWLAYVEVADLDESLAGCTELGGAVVQEPRELGAYGRIAVIRDPAGAHLALVEPPSAGE